MIRQTKYMNRIETISYIRRIKKDIKKGRHITLSHCDHRGIVEYFKYSPLEIASRFLRRKGYPITIRKYIVPLGPLCFGRPLSVLRYVSVVY